MEFLSWIITALVVALLLTFARALVSLRRLPLGERPETRTYRMVDGKRIGLLREVELDAQRDELLLDAVVNVALYPSSLGIRRLHQANP